MRTAVRWPAAILGALALLLFLLAPLEAAPKAEPVPGPLGRESGRIQGEGILRIRVIPEDEDEPVATIGTPVHILLTAAVVPAQVSGHPFEFFALISEPPEDGDKPDLSEPYVRCGTVTAAGGTPVPAKAISVSHTPPTRQRKEERATYSVARTSQVTVGYVDLPRLLEAAGMGLAGEQVQLAMDSFSLSIEPGGNLRFYASAKSKGETFAVMVEVPVWKYITAG